MSRRKQNTATVSGSRRTTVEVLLAKDVPYLGKRGEIVRVKPGYARNYLLPQGLATVATEENKRRFEAHRKRLEQLEAERKKQLKSLANQLSKHSVTLEANANKDGYLYGSIGANDIAQALQEAGFDVQPEHIQLEGALKELGMYTVAIQLHPEISTEIKVWVVPTSTQSGDEK